MIILMKTTFDYLGSKGIKTNHSKAEIKQTVSGVDYMKFTVL